MKLESIGDRGVRALAGSTAMLGLFAALFAPVAWGGGEGTESQALVRFVFTAASLLLLLVAGGSAAALLSPQGRSAVLAYVGSASFALVASAAVVGWYARVDPETSNVAWQALFPWVAIAATVLGALTAVMTLSRPFARSGIPTSLAYAISALTGIFAALIVLVGLLSPFFLPTLAVAVFVLVALTLARSPRRRPNAAARLTHQ